MTSKNLSAKFEPTRTGWPAADRGVVMGLQYLRFFAAFAVVYFHTGVLAANYAWPSFLPRAFGESGVDLFFIISGFVMMHVTAGRSARPADFLVRRFERIAPLYWGITLVAVAVGLAIPNAMLDNKVEFSHVMLSLSFIPHVHPVPGKGGPFYGVGWTLNYEMYFYVMFAFLLFALKRPGQRVAALIAWCATTTIAFLIFDPRMPIVRVYSNPILCEFVAGATIGWMYHRGFLQRMPLRGALTLFIVGLALLTTYTESGEIRVVWQGVGAAALVAGALGLEAHGRIPRLPSLALLGDATYAIYLIHPIVLTMFRVGARQLHLPVEQLGFGAPLVVIMTLASVAAGLLTHLWIERPLMDFFRRGRERRQLARQGDPAE